MYYSNKVKPLLKSVPSRVPKDLADGFEDESSPMSTAKGKQSSIKKNDIGLSDDDSDELGNISLERTAFGKADQHAKRKEKRTNAATSTSSSAQLSRSETEALKLKRRKVSSDEEESTHQPQRPANKSGTRNEPDELFPDLLEKPTPPPSSSIKSNTSSEDPIFGGKKHKVTTSFYGRGQNQSSGRTRIERRPREQQTKKVDEFKKATFQRLPSEDKISPLKKKKPVKFQAVNDFEASDSDASPVKFQRPPSVEQSSQTSTSSMTQRVKPKHSAAFNERFSNKPLKKKMGKPKKQPSEEEPTRPKAVFIHVDAEDLGPIDENVGLTSDEDASADGQQDEVATAGVEGDVEEQYKQTSRCPWCGDKVDEKLLKDFSNGERMNVRRQTKFCQEHKKHVARSTWESRGYPHIDWDELPDRIVSHYDSLFEIIDGRESHYRTLLARKIEAGESRSMKKEENLNPGYYGPRGFNLMCDRLVEKFGQLLKKRAVKDCVVSGRGSAAFIQTVLVAELAILLIMDDMAIESYDEAKAVMEESKALGDIVNEEI